MANVSTLGGNRTTPKTMYAEAKMGERRPNRDTTATSRKPMANGKRAAGEETRRQIGKREHHYSGMGIVRRNTSAIRLDLLRNRTFARSGTKGGRERAKRLKKRDNFR